MNINKIYWDLTNEQILALLDDMKVAEVTGSFTNNSPIRDLCRKIAEVTGLDVSSNLLMVQMGVYKEAANRYKQLLEKTEIKKVIPLYEWDGYYESHQIGDLEISRIDNEYFTSNIAETNIQIGHRKSIKAITKEQYENYFL